MHQQLRHIIKPFQRFLVGKLLSVVHSISNCYMLKLIKKGKIKTKQKMETEQK